MPSRRLVLLGVGHTNAEVVRRWATSPQPGVELVCVSTQAEATYSGMLPGVLGGQLPPESMRIDLRRLVERAGGRLVLGETVGLDREAGRLLLADHEPIAFDALSVGVGSEPAEWRRHAEAASLVAIKPMQTFQERLQPRLDGLAPDQVARLSVVGGGAAGIEIALCLDRRLGRSHADRGYRVTIYTAADRLATDMSGRSRRRLERLLADRGVAVVSGERVTRVGDASLEIESGAVHGADAVVWAVGASAPPVLGKLGLETDDRGFLATLPTLQSTSDPRVFAVGDSGTILAHPTVKAGAYAVRQAPVLWRNLEASFRGEPLQDYHPQSNFLKLLNTGDGRALLEWRGLTAHARWCWWLKQWIDRRFVNKYSA